MTTISNARKYSLGAAYLTFVLRLGLLFGASMIALTSLALSALAQTPQSVILYDSSGRRAI